MLRPYFPPARLKTCGRGLLSVMLLAGCGGKIPTFEELTNQNSGQPTQQPITSPPPVQPAAAPVKQDPAEAVAAFQAIPANAHDDNTLGKLLSLDEGLELVTEIKAANSKVTDHGMALIHKLPSLQRLDLVGTTVSDKGCESIGKVSSLEELTLSGGLISDVGMAHLANLTQLKKLVVNGTKIGLAGWEIIGQLPALEEIWIQQSSLNDEAMDALCNATTLRRLHMNDTAISDRGLTAFRKLELLEVLNLSGCNVSCEGLGAVVKSKGLKNLLEMSVQRTPLSAKGAAAIGGMKQLEVLNIAELPTGLNDQYLRVMLKDKKNLRWLNVNTNRGVTNHGIAALKGNPDLEFVDLSKNPQINNQCLPTFAKMKKLHTIVFDGTGITLEAVQQLAKDLPEYNKVPRS